MTTTALAARTLANHIGGSWVRATTRETLADRDPATGELLAHVSRGDAAAAARQVTTLAFNANWGTAHPPALELAERLAGEPPGALNRVFFTSGGSESAEARWKLCREYHLANGQPQTNQGDRA